MSEVRPREPGESSRDGVTRRAVLTRAGAIAWALPTVTVGMAAPAMAATTEPNPDVGTIRHLCGGAHTFAFIIPVTGLPPNTPVQLTASFTPGGSRTEGQITDGTGTANFQFTFPRTGPPVRCRSLEVSSYRLDPFSDPIPLEGSYTGCCP